MVVKVKEKFEKVERLKIMIKVKSMFQEDKEVNVMMIEFYLIKRNLVIKIYCNFII